MNDLLKSSCDLQNIHLNLKFQWRAVYHESLLTSETSTASNKNYVQEDS